MLQESDESQVATPEKLPEAPVEEKVEENAGKKDLAQPVEAATKGPSNVSIYLLHATSTLLCDDAFQGPCECYCPLVPSFCSIRLKQQLPLAPTLISFFL